MFSDSQQIINLVAPLSLCAVSALVWFAAWWRPVDGKLQIPAAPRPIDPIPAGIVLLALPVSVLVQISAMTWFAEGRSPQENPLDLLHVDIAARGLAWLSLCLLPLAAGPWPRGYLGFRRGGTGTEIGLGLLTAIAAIGPVLLINLLLAKVGAKDPQAIHPLLEALKSDPARLLPLVLLSSVVLAPLQEELLYRVLLQGGLETRASPRLAILVSTLLFCAVHFGRGRPDGIALLPLAGLLGYLQWQRHSYAASVSCHALFNLINVSLAVLLPSSKPV